MPAALGWYDSDGVTPMSSLDLGILQPGEDYYTKYGAYYQAIIKNTGDVALSSVSVEIQQAGGYDAYTFAAIATGGTPGAFVDYTTDPLSVGALGVGSQANVWINVSESAASPAAQGKAFSLAASGVA